MVSALEVVQVPYRSGSFEPAGNCLSQVCVLPGLNPLEAKFAGGPSPPRMRWAACLAFARPFGGGIGRPTQETLAADRQLRRARATRCGDETNPESTAMANLEVLVAAKKKELAALQAQIGSEMSGPASSATAPARSLSSPTASGRTRPTPCRTRPSCRRPHPAEQDRPRAGEDRVEVH